MTCLALNHVQCSSLQTLQGRLRRKDAIFGVCRVARIRRKKDLAEVLSLGSVVDASVKRSIRSAQ
jgi:hypothetical protein